MSEHIELVQRFLGNRPAPGVSDDTHGLIIDISCAIEDHDAFVLRSYSHEDGVGCFHVEYVGDDDCMGDIDREFFSLYGMFSLRQQYIEQCITSDAIVFWILTGYGDMLGPAVRIRIEGDRAT
ncbi:MAG: hypothetical protein ACE5E6_12155, partial [Phycisphaerae bacterium]